VVRYQSRTQRTGFKCLANISLQVRPKSSEAVSSVYKWENTVPNGGCAAWEPTRSSVCWWRLCWS